MTISEIRNAIAALGWEHDPDWGKGHRARCGDFFTPYRAVAEETLADVKAVKEKAKHLE